MKLVDTEHIIMGKELTDTEINLAQQLLKKQFPNLNRFKSTLLQDKMCSLTEKEVRDKVQIIVDIIGLLPQLGIATLDK